MVWSGVVYSISRFDMEIDNMRVLEGFLRKSSLDYTVLKVIPHVSNLNSNSRKFQYSMYELFSHRYPRFPWQRENSGVKDSFSKENLYVDLVENPKLWWIVKMEGVHGGFASEEELQHRIEFFVVIPSDFKEAFKTKFYNHQQWKSATLDEYDDFSFIDDVYTDIYALKYLRSDMFSLEFDYAQQSTPIRDLLSVSRELAVGESIYFVVQIETMKRMKWKSLVDYAWSQWEKGGVPTRPGFDPMRLSRDLVYFGSVALYQAKYIIDEVLAGVRMSVFNDKDGSRGKEEFKVVNLERQELLVNGDLSKRTKAKRNLPAFKTNILYTVTSKDGIRREMIARSVANAFSEMNGDNVLKMMKLDKKHLKGLVNWKVNLFGPNIMSVDEVGKLMQLPTADVQKDFRDSLMANVRIEKEVEDELLDESGILAGEIVHHGERKGVYIQKKNIDLTSTARVIIGSPRMGKDQAAINLVVESKIKHNMGSVVIDVINEQNEHRGMADSIRDHLDEDDVIDLDLSNADYPIYLGLEPIVEVIDNQRIASDRIAEELCAFLLQDGDGEKLQTADHLREAVKLTNGDILGIKYLFTSKGYRDKILSEKKDLFDVDIWEQFDRLSDARQQAIYMPVMRRLGQILNSEYLKPIFCQEPNKRLDLFKLLDEGKVIIFRMKTGIMSQRVIEILVYWVVLIVFLTKLGQQGKSKCLGTYLILNEPHQYLTSGLVHFIERIFAEGPKYRLIPILIFHNFKQFKRFPGFVDIMKSASLNWHLFRNTNEDVYKELFGYLNKTFQSPAEAFEATKLYQYIGVWLSSEGEYYDPFVADALPLVKNRYKTRNNAHLTKMHSQLYGRPINEVLEYIKRRNKEVLELNNKG